MLSSHCIGGGTGAFFSWAPRPYLRRLPGEQGAHTPWGNFLLVQKVTKNTLRGSTPKDPGFWNRVAEGFISPTGSAAGLPTNPGTRPTAPDGRVGTSCASVVSA